MIDCQVSNPHLLSLGSHRDKKREFLDLLASGLLEEPIDWTEHSGVLELKL